MPKQLGAKKLYLYAIVGGDGGKIIGAVGLDGGTVYSIASDHVAAVVSDIAGKLRPERRHLAAHQEVLKRLMAEEAAVLPVSFGVLLDGAVAARKILSQNQKALTEQVRHVGGRVEMGLRVAWDVPNIFEYFVDTHPELYEARERLFRGSREPSQDDKIEIGRLFDRLLQEDREAHAEQVEEALGPHCVEIKRGKLRSEREAVNMACLVARDRQAEFEAAVFDAAAGFDNNYSFDYSGPWAPHNFVEVSLDLRPRGSARAAGGSEAGN